MIRKTNLLLQFALLYYHFTVASIILEIVKSQSTNDNNRQQFNDDEIYITTCPICNNSSSAQQQNSSSSSYKLLRPSTIPPPDVINSQMPTFFTKLNDGELSISENDNLNCAEWQTIINEWLQKRCQDNQQYCDEFCSIFEEWLEQSCCEEIQVQQQEEVVEEEKSNSSSDSKQHHACEICSVENSTLITTTIPPKLSQSEMPIFLTDDELASINLETMSCGQWQSYIDTKMNEKKEFCQSTDEQYCHDFCLSFENWLEYTCCEGGILPRYQCQEIVRNSVLVSHDDGIPYDKIVAPLSGDYSSGISVHVSVTIKEYKIVNYGVNGGAIEVQLTTTESWVDERLHWDPKEVGGCTQIHVQASLDPLESEIWVPGRGKVVKHDHSSTDATVLADGSVIWERQLKVIANCETVHDHVTKLCKFSFSDEGGLYAAEDGINFNVGRHYDIEGKFNGGVHVMKKSTLPGYSLNKNRTILSCMIDETTGNKDLILNIHFDPLVTQCYLCGGIGGVKLRRDKIPSNNNDGGLMALSSNVDGWTCEQIESYLSTSYNVNDTKCDLGRQYYTESCCEGIQSRNTCENNIRTMISKKLKGDIIAPPDPISGHSMIDVEILLDFNHIIDIDVKLNTLEVLVSLELFWHDDRLKWDPFVGGCGVASFAASVNGDPEIWVPEIDLLDHVEGVQMLPKASAIVFQDGLVWWKRTGVLVVACDLTGLKYFPFDSPSCNMDFGATRSPLAHRVNYTARGVKFSEHLELQKGRYHEYRVSADETKIIQESEPVSSYINSFVRYTFFFERSFTYYLWAFIILYIMFTYLSFGMFFLDQRVGERLAFGTGMLFVIVAEDITIAERTPVSQLQLWINDLSFVSKVHIIIGIVESIAILYFFFVNDLDDEEEINKFDQEWQALLKTEERNDNNYNDSIYNNRFHQGNSSSFIKYDRTYLDDEDETENGLNLISEESSINKVDDDNNGSSNNDRGTAVGTSLPQDVESTTSDTNHKSAAIHQKNNNGNKRGIRISGIGKVRENNNKKSRRDHFASGASTMERSFRTFKSFDNKLGRKASWCVSYCLGYEVDREKDSLAKQKLLKLRLWDRVMALLMFFTYTIFVIYMFLIAEYGIHDHH